MSSDNDKNKRIRGVKSVNQRLFKRTRVFNDIKTMYDSTTGYCWALNNKGKRVKIKKVEFEKDIIENNSTIIPNEMLFTYIADEFSKMYEGHDLSDKTAQYPFGLIVNIAFDITKADIVEKICDIKGISPVSIISFNENIYFEIDLINEPDYSFNFKVLTARII